MAERFARASELAGRAPLFFGVERPLGATAGFRHLRVGAQPIWVPGQWQSILGRVRSLREQLRRARAKRVTVRHLGGDELTGEQSSARRQLDRLVARWRSGRGMPPMSFLVAVHLYSLVDERRYLIAEQSDSVVGVLAMAPTYGPTPGWFVEYLIRDPAAPNGTSELLFHNAMEELAAAGSERVSFGLAPLAGEVPAALEAIRRRTTWLYDFDGLLQFKRKLRPDHWEDVFVAIPPEVSTVRATVEVLRAFAGGNLHRFGARTLYHRAPLIVWLLALLLLPWTTLLANAPTPFWFGTLETKAGWILYDIALFAGLTALAVEWRRWLALLLSAAAAADFAVGLLQARALTTAALSAPEWFALTAALVAPAFAAGFLFLCRNRAALYHADR